MHRSCLIFALIIFLVFVLPTFAGESSETLVLDAARLARAGKTQESMKSIEKAIARASAGGSGPEVIEGLRIKRISLLFENQLNTQGLDAAREALSDSGKMLASLKRDPEVSVDIDETFHRLLQYGTSADSLEGLKLAVAWCSALPQFGNADKVRANRLVCDWQAQHEHWAEAEQCASQAFDRLGRTEPLFLARMRMACIKQHKEKDVPRLTKQMIALIAKGTPIYTLSSTAMLLLDSGDSEAALPYAENACAIAAKIKVGPQGNWDVSRAFSTRARIELARGETSKAEVDARKALTASVGKASGFHSSDSMVLEDILRREKKFAQADALRVQRGRSEWNP